MGLYSWEPLGPKWPGIQWKGYGDARRYRCLECKQEHQCLYADFRHLPDCETAKRVAD